MAPAERGPGVQRAEALGARTRAEKAARAARVAKEMRLNLLKRKAQQRAKRDQGKPGSFAGWRVRRPEARAALFLEDPGGDRYILRIRIPH